MGRFSSESNKMKVLIAGLLCATVVLALPEGRRLRAEEHWRPAQGRDLSKYKPKQAVVPVPATKQDLSWAIKAAKKSGASTKKGTNFDLKATCGVEGPPAAGRIVGGIEAEEHEWPWQVALFIDDAWFCGGSLISETYVLTAAHCAQGASYFDIMLGAHNIRASSEPNRVEITSYNGWTHPQWNSNTLANDIALVQLPTPAPINDYISPVCLPAPGEVVGPGDMVCVTGWGKTTDASGGISPNLQEVCNLPVISNADCTAVYGNIDEGVFCVDTTGGRGSCNGDSGGPAIMRVSRRGAGDQWKEVGIVSFGSSAGCESGMPAAFTRVEHFLDWILTETGM